MDLSRWRALAALLAAGALAAAGSRPAAAPAPVIRLDAEAGSPGFGTVEAAGLASTLLDELARRDLTAEVWRTVFAVYTGTAAPSTGDRPAVAGSWEIEDGVLRFRPRYPFVPGLLYSARLDLARLHRLATGLDSSVAPIETSFSLPRPATEPSTVVREVYPTASEVPENLLKLYLHFSAPMSRGEAYRRVHLLDAAGRALEHVFIEIDEELWDPGQRRLTLFFDPGRIKRGLRPHREAGPPLEEGKAYRLVIDRDWRDAAGLPLAAGFEKALTAAAPDRRSPDPADWRIAPPSAGTLDPLELRFPEPLDHGLLQRMIRVTAAGEPLAGEPLAGEPLAGRLEIDSEERRLRFTPPQPWRAGTYRIEVDARLEDLAGNNLSRVFDADLGAAPPEPAAAAAVLPFRVVEP